MSGKKKKESKRKVAPPWQLHERVVAALERTVSPDAKVLHNIKLPNLTLPGEECQCDVVIRAGKPPRETITIVEVQKRGRAVEVNTFRGWCEKLRQVGAQHLICVSTKGFPASVVRDAELRGPSVRLLKLREIEEGQEERLMFALGKPYAITRSPFVIKEITIDWPSTINPRPVSADERVFRLATGHLATVEEITRNTINSSDRPAGRQPFRFSTRKREMLRYEVGGLHVPVHLTCVALVNVERVEVNLSAMSYDQQDTNGTIAWVMAANADFGDRVIRVCLTYLPADDGRLMPGRFEVGGMDDESPFHVVAGNQVIQHSVYAGEEVVSMTRIDEALPLHAVPTTERLRD